MSLESDVAQEIADMDSTFGVVAPAVQRNKNSVPDGNYRVLINVVHFKRSEKSQELLLEWNMEVYDEEGDYNQAPLERVNFLRTDKNIAWMKNDLEKAGLECAKLTVSQIVPLLPSLSRVVIDVTTKKDGKYFNVYINGVADIDAGEAPPTLGDDDVPDVTDPFADQ
jgi:hypothetical protein